MDFSGSKSAKNDMKTENFLKSKRILKNPYFALFPAGGGGYKSLFRIPARPHPRKNSVHAKLENLQRDKMSTTI